MAEIQLWNQDARCLKIVLYIATFFGETPKRIISQSGARQQTGASSKIFQSFNKLPLPPPPPPPCPPPPSSPQQFISLNSICQQNVCMRYQDRITHQASHLLSISASSLGLQI